MMQTDHPGEAVAAFQQAVTLSPGYAEGHYNLAQVFMSVGRHADAAAALRDAIRLRPDWPTAMGALAWLEATTDSSGADPGETVRLAERAADLSRRRDVAVLDALGAAHAAAGQFAEAARVAAEAEALALQTAPHLVPDISARLRMYREGKALVDRDR